MHMFSVVANEKVHPPEDSESPPEGAVHVQHVQMYRSLAVSQLDCFWEVAPVPLCEPFI